MLIFHSFLYVYQRVYVLLYIVYIYIYICKDTLTLILLVYRMVYPHTQEATVAMYSDPRRWQWCATPDDLATLENGGKISK